MANKHVGDRKSPRPGVVPLPSMAFLWLINGGDPNYLQVPGMILQVKGKSIILFKRVGTGLVSEWVLMFLVPKQLLTAGCPWSTMDTRVSQGF